MELDGSKKFGIGEKMGTGCLIATILVLIVCVTFLVVGWLIAGWMGVIVALLIDILIWDFVLHSNDE